MTFTQPGYFFLFVPILLYVVWYIVKGWNCKPSLKVSTTAPFLKGARGVRTYFVHLPFVFRIVALSMLAFALARPQTESEWDERNIEGIDIMLATDASGSMMEQDLKPTRFDAAKDVAIEFINSRPNDNIGLTFFAGESFVQCPLTNMHDVLISMLEASSVESIASRMDNGTAIGMGIATSVSRLVGSKAKSKVIILLTDGVNNTGQISPETAAEKAKENGIRVYTIGAATDKVPSAYQYGFGGNSAPLIDEATLESIAEITGGKYFRATDRESLKRIYNEIDKLERTKLHVKDYKEYKEEFQIFALIALAALLLELLLRYTILRRIP